MQNGKFKYQLKNNNVLTEISGECFYSEEKILSFCESDNTQISIDLKQKTFQRENEEMLLSLDFETSRGQILVKELNKKLELQLRVNSSVLENRKFVVSYTLAEYEDFEFSIEWILDGE